MPARPRTLERLLWVCCRPPCPFDRPPPPPPTAPREVLDGGLTKARALRQRYDKVMCSYGELRASIDGDPAWAWAGAPALTRKLDSAKAAVDSFKGGSGFWQAWALHSNFGPIAKKDFKVQLPAQLARLPDLEAAVVALEAEISVILRMQGARAA